MIFSFYSKVNSCISSEATHHFCCSQVIMNHYLPHFTQHISAKINMEKAEMLNQSKIHNRVLSENRVFATELITGRKYANFTPLAGH